MRLNELGSRVARRGVACAIATALAGLPSAGSAAILVGDDPVLYWNSVLAGGLAGSPTTSSRGYAMVGVAIHDAANATLGGGDNSYLTGVATYGGDTRAATATAARNVLVTINPGKAAEYDAALAASLALVSDGAAKDAGIATGASVAAAMLALRTGDGSGGVVPYAPSGLPGDWAPTPPGNAPGAVPQWGGVDTWNIATGDQFRAAPPPEIGSAEYAAAFAEVRDIGSLGSLTRTADQSASAKFWEAASGTAPWIQAGLQGAQSEGLSTLENARLFALLTTSIADAAIATWDSKYFYDYWRPVTAIRLADLDGNSATDADPTWISYITAPPHPSYVSGHSAVSAAASTVLADLLGDSNPFCLTSSVGQRCFDGFEAAAQDAANSRLWGGIHWSFDNAAGLQLGSEIARYALASSAFDAVPEPTTWALMIVGFGMAGTMFRRRRLEDRRSA